MNTLPTSLYKDATRKAWKSKVTPDANGHYIKHIDVRHDDGKTYQRVPTFHARAHDCTTVNIGGSVWAICLKDGVFYTDICLLSQG